MILSDPLEGADPCTVPAITGTGVFTPDQIITNDELVEAFNAYAEKHNAEHATAIAAGEVRRKSRRHPSSLSAPRAFISAMFWTRPVFWTPM